jgi:hypothetical protein
MPSTLNRRHFTLLAAAALTARAQSALTPVSTIEHDHILADAANQSTTTTLDQLSAAIAAHAAAFLLTHDATYAQQAQTLLAQLPTESPTSVLDLLPCAEIAVALPHLAPHLPPDQLAALYLRLTSIQTFLNTDRSAQIDRDRKDHRASAWLLLQSAIAHAQPTDDPLGSSALEACRARFRHPTLRNQITADGTFPQELATENPFRNTLFNFDLLAGACQLLASPFDDLWSYQLIDEVGLRSVAAWLVPKISDPATWPTISDAAHFHTIPLRRPALLFAGRAYNRPEYVNLFRTLPAPNLSTLPTDLTSTFPIRQPLLWTTKSPHHLSAP